MATMKKLSNRRTMWIAACCRRNRLTLSEAHRVLVYFKGEQTAAEFDALPPALKQAIDDVEKGCWIDGEWRTPPVEARFRCSRCGMELEKADQSHGKLDIFSRSNGNRYRACGGKGVEA
jgi:hypothetical protein